MREIGDVEKDQIKAVSEKQVEKQLRFIGDLIIHPGQKCWEYNPNTGEVVLAKMEVVVNPFATGVKIDFYLGTKGGQSKFENKVITKPECLYCVAINLKNAKRKFKMTYS